jgi:UDP-N-acetylglucosamine/UDP-N-acetylgalactosamine diphosphorylase
MMKPRVASRIREAFAAHGQEHVFRFVERGHLDNVEAASFLASLDALDLGRIGAIYEAANKSAAAKADSAKITPVPVHGIDSVLDATAKQLNAWRKLGLAALESGSVAALVMAGGQGTRLGFDGPKGLFDVELPSKKCLFHLLAERLIKLETLCGTQPLLVVMTSLLNIKETQQAFEAAKYYGLAKSSVVFFSQDTLPAFSPDGKLFLQSGTELALAPDGNGGIYHALSQTGTLQQLEAQGVSHVHVISVDNALCKPCDPVFIGYCISKNVPVGSKVCWKNSPAERVGVLCERGGRPAVVEYSELPSILAHATNAHGELLYGAGNICNHLLRSDFLALATTAPPRVLPYHIASKAIPFADNDDYRGARKQPKADAIPNAIKLEAFIFDAFMLASRQAALIVSRKEEFAPVKNHPAKTHDDTPITARAALLVRGAIWAQAAGAVVQGKGGVEVSPLRSYAGEGLSFLAGETLDATNGPVSLL